MDIDLDKPITNGDTLRLRDNASTDMRISAARMDAIKYLVLTGEPITTSSVDRLINEMRDFPVACKKEEKV